MSLAFRWSLNPRSVVDLNLSFCIFKLAVRVQLSLAVKKAVAIGAQHDQVFIVLVPEIVISSMMRVEFSAFVANTAEIPRLRERSLSFLAPVLSFQIFGVRETWKQRPRVKVRQ